MNNQENKKPVDTLRDGALKATIWKNTGENGDFYSVDLARIYTKQGKNGTPDTFHDTNSYSGTQLLQIARLADKAYDRVAKLRAIDKAASQTA